jgi:hypothetical protein
MSFWGKVKGTLAVVAPTLGAAVGGPLGGVAGMMLGKALGKPEGASEEDLVTSLLGASPEQIVELKKAELEFQKFLRENDIKIEQIHAGDRASAREREVAVKDRTPAVLGYSITAGFFGILTWMLINGLPEDGSDALLLMLGSLGTAWTGIIAYYFGSSAGSKIKDTTISTLRGRG